MRVASRSHVDVKIDNGDIRSHSIVSGSVDGTSVRLGVRLSPTSCGGWKYMHSLEPGDEINLAEPLQNFPLRIGAPRYLLLAGGIGVTAMVAMATALRRVGADYQFVYVGRSRSAMAVLPELFAEHGDRMKLRIDDEGTGLDIATTVSDADASTELYTCGAIRLMDGAREHGSSEDYRYRTSGTRPSVTVGGSTYRNFVW